MREHAWAGRLGRRKVRTTVPDKTAAPAPDLVKRQFSPAEPDQTWCGDITYIPTGEGWLYLSTVIDLFSRRVIGWSLADHMRAELVGDALGMAVATRGGQAAGVVFHSDYAEVFVKPRNRGLVCCGRGLLTGSSA
jgi:transposase InsO family protein